MSKNLIQKISRIIKKQLEKLTEIELIKILNHDSTVIVDVSIEFRINNNDCKKSILLRKNDDFMLFVQQ